MSTTLSTPPPTKPYVSATQLEMLAKCPEQYRRRYIERDVIPPGFAIVVGSALHTGAETNFKQKLETRRDLPKSQIVEAAVAGFEAQLAGGIALTDEEASRGLKIVTGEAKDNLVEIAEVHADWQAPEYQPVMVEQTVRIELPGKHDLLGVIDLVDERKIVTDFKTAKKKKSQDDADSSIQLSVYHAAYQALTGEEPAEVRLDTIVKQKTKTERQVVSSERTPDDMQALANRINVASQVIQLGVFAPATPGAWWCGPKWCGYWSTCPFVNSERKALAERE
jgi:hypothetical protein